MSKRAGEGAGRNRQDSANQGNVTMELKSIDTAGCEPEAGQAGDLLVARTLAAAAGGDVSALFDLGVVYSTGSHLVACDLIEAHKWFNIAAARGHEEAAYCRADVADEMTAREIAEAQRRARRWLADERLRAA